MTGCGPSHPELTGEDDGVSAKPYLNFNGTTRQALEFYQSVFGGSLNLNTFGDFGAKDSPDAKRIMHGVLETDAGYTIMAADVTSDMQHHPMAGLR